MASKAIQKFGIQFVNGSLAKVFTIDDACKLWDPFKEDHILELKAGGEVVFKAPSKAIIEIENLTLSDTFEAKYDSGHKSHLTGPDGRTPLNN